MFVLDGEDYREVIGRFGVCGCLDKDNLFMDCGGCAFHYRCTAQVEEALRIEAACKEVA